MNDITKIVLKIPKCPYCKTNMVETKYIGYYDSFTYWKCDCDELQNIKHEWNGSYVCG